MTEKNFKVSVCVITYNQAQYIRTCLDSILKQKTEFDFEVIIGDDCSTDGTREIVEEYAARYPHVVKAILHEKNIGPTGNYMSVHAAAIGELVGHCDGDDYWLPGKLQAQTRFMDAYPQCHVSGHRMYQMDSTGRQDADGRPLLPTISDISAFYRYGNFLSHSSTMYRASCGRVLETDGETIDYLLHIWRVGTGAIGFLNEYYGVYRRHSASTTVRLSQSLAHFRLNLDALERIHQIVGDEDEFERRKFALCRRCIKNFIAGGRIELAREIARNAHRYVVKDRHRAFLALMVLCSDLVGWTVRTKRNVLRT
jgi:glycosyltransferase involved in cell wall biosynthesis